MPDKIFPTEEWLRKRGKWADRDGPTYNTMSIYIKTWIGGVRELRRLLDQSHASTNQWDRDSVLVAWKKFWETHGMTPHQYRYARKAVARQNADPVLKEAGRLVSAVVKYVGGGPAANEALGIETERVRRWSRDAILKEFQEVIDHFGAAPSQLIGGHRSGEAPLAPDYYKRLCQLVDATHRQFGSVQIVYDALQFKLPKRPRRKRRPRQAQ